MRKILLGVLLGGLGVAGWTHFQAPGRAVAAAGTDVGTPEPDFEPEAEATPAGAPSFSCDGRKYCSEMTSCDEASYFLANCPGAKMDGDGDGIPCEGQWCGH
jgi:hypothetical protein